MRISWLTPIFVLVTFVVEPAGWANADSAGGALRYACTLSPFPAQPMTAQLTWSAPASVPVGQTTPTVTVTAVATVGSAVTWALGLIGAKTVEGSVDAPGAVAAPEGSIPAAVRLTVPRTPVPASGSLTVRATGTAPRLVFHQSGHATISVEKNLTLRFTPRDGAGNPAGPGAVDLSCALESGQDPVVFAFDITPAPATPIPPTGPANAPGGASSPGTRDTTAPGPGSVSTGSATPIPATDATTPPTDPTSEDPTTTGSAGADPTTTGSAGAGQTARSTAFRAAGPRGVPWWPVTIGILVAGAIGAAWWLLRRRVRG
jgi:hypothetical protein